MLADIADMTARTLRAALKRLRESRGWTHAERAADVHTLSGAPIVSKDTLRIFLMGGKLSARLETVLSDYAEKRASMDALRQAS